MGRFLTHLVLTGALAVAPVLRVLCYSSCMPELGAMARTMAASDATPECHERDDSHHSAPESDSAPPQDDCMHGGESASSSLSASGKSVGGDRPKLSVISMVAVAQLSVVLSDICRDAQSTPSAGQRLGRFLTPLRI